MRKIAIVTTLVMLLTALTVSSIAFAGGITSEASVSSEKIKQSDQGKLLKKWNKEAVKAKIDQMVKDGKLSADEAEKKLSAIEKRSKYKKGHFSKKWSGPFNKEVVKAKIDQMVKDGKLSADEAEKKLMAIEKRSQNRKGHFSKTK